MAATKTIQKATNKYVLTAGGNYSKTFENIGDIEDPLADNQAKNFLNDYGKIVDGTSKEIDVAIVKTYEA